MQGRTAAAAIGARVELVLAYAGDLAGDAWQTSSSAMSTRSIHRLVSGGSSYGGNSLRLEVGLGVCTGVERVAIRWTSGRVQVLRGLRVNTSVVVIEGQDDFRVLNEEPFRIRQDMAEAQPGCGCASGVPR